MPAPGGLDGLVIAKPLRVLLVEDSAADAALVLRELRRGGVEVLAERVEDEAAMREALARGGWDALISDWALPRFSGLEALGVVRSLDLDIPTIIVSGTIGEETAVEAMRAGAHDFVLKDRTARLRPALERELREHAARCAHRAGQAALLESRAQFALSEERLRQSQKMDAIGQLAGGIAHDFNNILSVIIGYSNMLAADLAEADPLRVDLLEIEKAGNRAGELTRQLLAFGRRQRLEPSVARLDEVVRAIETMLRRTLPASVELTITSDPDLGNVHVDTGQMEQVVLNLVVNARDAMPSGGKLTIETSNVTLDEDEAIGHGDARAGRYVLLAVSDTGIGMDRATQARVFEPFFTTKEDGKGTGLGLATVFGIVKQSGGSIWLYSEPGDGTTFKIYLPRTDEEAAPAAGAPKAVRPLGGNETILLVEDEESVRKLVRAVLQQGGYHVLDARSAGDALILCEQHKAKIHLLLTDVIMPRMNGRELAERVLALRPYVKVLYMSGYTDGSIVRHGVLDSTVAFLQKPMTPDVLARKVREVLDR